MRYLYNIIVYFSFLSIGFCQIPCGAPVMGSFCDQTCVNCDLNGASLTTAQGPVGEMPQGYCTFIAHHMQWLGFIAGSPSLSIRIDVTACAVGTGIEAGIYSGCDPQNLVSNCETAMFVGQWTLTTNVPLEVGCPYYIVFDGNGPAECDFDITVLSGSTSAPDVNISDIIGVEEVCVGETESYIVNADGACDKQWTVVGGVIEGDDDQLEVDITWTTPGLGRVCFSGSNACDPGGMECLDVLVHPDVPDTELGPFLICDDEVYTHDGVDYGDGYYELMYKNDFDCDSLVILIVEEVFTHYEDIEVVLCEGECYTKSQQTFCNPGSFQVTVQSDDEPFCDSVFTIDLEIYKVHPIISQFGSLGCGDTSVVLRTRDSSLLEGDGFLEYVWRNENGDVVGIEDSLTVNIEGKYCVQVLMSSNDGKTCQNDTCFTVIGMDVTPELLLESNPAICLGDSLDLRSLVIREIHDIDGELSYHTSFPPTSNNEILPPVIFSTVDTTIVVHFKSGTCTDDLIVDIKVQPQPDISVVDTIHICEGDTLFLNDIEIVLENGIMGVDSFYTSIDFNPNNQILDYLFTDSSQTIYLKSELTPCFDFESIFVQIHEIPIANIGILPDSICQEDIINFSLLDHESLEVMIDPDGGILSDFGDGNYEIQWTTSGWKKLTVNVENEYCSSSELCVDVFVQAPLLPLDLDCMTNDSTITFSWSNANFNGDYDIQVLTGQAIQNQSNNDLTIGGLSTKERVEVVVTVSTPGPCPDISDTVSCIAIFCPDIDITLPDDQLICLDQNTSNLDLTPNVLGSDGTGIIKWFGNGIVDSLSSTFDPNLAGEGEHIITVIIEENECFFQDEITITVVRVPEISISSVDTICLTENVNLVIDTLWTNGAIANWDFGDANATPGNGISNQTLNWSTPGMKTINVNLTKRGCASQNVVKNIWVDPPLEDITLSCESTFTTIEVNWNNIINIQNFDVSNSDNFPIRTLSPTSIIVENLQPGTTTTFTIIARSNNSCPDITKEITCSTDECPIIDITMQDTSACISDAQSVRLPISINGDISVGTAEWQGPGISNSSIGTFDPNIAGVGRHKIIYTFTNDVCIFKDSMIVELFDDPIADAGTDAEINCINNSVQLGGTNTTTGNNITYLWDGNINDKTIKDPIVTEAGTYILTVKDEVSGCFSTDEIVITKNTTPPSISELEVIDIGCDPAVDLGVVHFTDLTGDGPFEVSINNQAFELLQQQSLVDLQQGIYQITIRDRKGCTVDTTIEIVNVPKISLDLGPDIEVDEGQSVQITANTTINYIDISWMAGQNLPCQNCDIQTFVPKTSMRVSCTVTDDFGCRSTDEVNIKVKIKSVFIPNSFTPNGDGINDEIIVYGSDEVESIALMDIYNRWGELVFHKTDIVPGQKSAGWKGRFNGKDLDPDVFILHVIVRYKDGEEVKFTRDVTLIK